MLIIALSYIMLIKITPRNMTFLIFTPSMFSAHLNTMLLSETSTLTKLVIALFGMTTLILANLSYG